MLNKELLLMGNEGGKTDGQSPPKECTGDYVFSIQFAKEDSDWVYRSKSIPESGCISGEPVGSLKGAERFRIVALILGGDFPDRIYLAMNSSMRDVELIFADINDNVIYNNLQEYSQCASPNDDLWVHTMTLLDYEHLNEIFPNYLNGDFTTGCMKIDIIY